MADDPKPAVPKVLFVDDEENVLRSLKRLLVDEKVDIYTASSGKAGLEILKEGGFSVIVSDQRMPEMSGAEFLEKAKRISPDAVRIVLTGYADVNAAMDAINKGGAYRYITKPWNDNDLVIAILNAVEMSNLQRENKYLTELTKKQNEELKKWSTELEAYVQQQTIDLSKKNTELTKLNERLNKNFSGFLSAFSNLIELRDRTVLSHSNTVSSISEDMAERMGLNSSEIETISIAAQLHDIGKIGIPDIVLLKTPETLTPDELVEYRKHPVRGQSAIDFIEDLRGAGILIRHHHEWFNGKGFPDGLKGKDIPVGARIISLADKFDRLRHGGYRDHNLKSVLEKIKSMIGTQFDPEVFVFLVETAKTKFTTVEPEADSLDLSSAMVVEVELNPKDLQAGMVVSRDIRSGTGLLMLRMGTTLNEKNIGTLTRGYHLDPANTGVFVWVKRK
ncbi:MAG: response regulator [Deltaproteobacteria bacterium]|nr:response regulator [Deltaproteobacteria bacterium]